MSCIFKRNKQIDVDMEGEGDLGGKMIKLEQEETARWETKREGIICFGTFLFYHLYQELLVT